MTTVTTLALIPARSGSKSLPHKNIREFAGKPLLAHSIEQALAARSVDRVIVSTDSEEYAAIARQYGAETPFLRPAELATDDATDLVVFRHALDWLRGHEGWEPDIVVHLRPTYPRRDPADIDRVIELLAADPELDSVRSVAPAAETPFKMWTRDGDGRLTPVADLGNEAYNQPRQRLPVAYLQNACIDAVRAHVVIDQGSMTGRRIHGYLMNENFDIDTEADFRRAREACTQPDNSQEFDDP
ncbi:MAG: cytidyltransferase [Gammaproteobacteria bacterium]|nr:cytidyltransferase [Gammaproteobacteria bacterium]